MLREEPRHTASGGLNPCPPHRLIALGSPQWLQSMPKLDSAKSAKVLWVFRYRFQWVVAKIEVVPKVHVGGNGPEQ